MRSLANLVHVSFRTVERAADWLTGSAGPFFIAICIILVLGGIWTFFVTMFPVLAPPPPEVQDLFRTHSPAHIVLGLFPTLLNSICTTPISAARFLIWLFVCLFIVWSIGWHYYMACTEPPGGVLDGLGDSVKERRSGPGSSTWWNRYRKRAAKASGPAIPKLSSAASHVAGQETYEAASPVRVDSSGDLRKAAEAKRARSGSMLARQPLTRSITEPSGKVSSNTSSHRSSSSGSSSPFATPKLGKTPLPTSIHDADSALHKLAPEADSDSDFDLDDDMFPLARMCHKCPKVTLAKALSVLPPELRRIEKKLRATKSDAKVLQPSFDEEEGEAEIRGWLGDEAADKLVPPPKPERTHHCRVCKTCTLKFDHHCPWLNQCVGLGNERYFVLFMTWLSVGCGVVAVSGYHVVKRSIFSHDEWPHTYVPRVFVLLLYVLAVVMGLALAVMAGWQFVLIARGETSVESNDNAHYRELAKQRSADFANVYDVGAVRNLQLFFNVGPGSAYAWYTVLLPRRIPPYADGWHWAKRRGMGGRHAGIKAEEELTDEEQEQES